MTPPGAREVQERYEGWRGAMASLAELRGQLGMGGMDEARREVVRHPGAVERQCIAAHNQWMAALRRSKRARGTAPTQSSAS